MWPQQTGGVTRGRKRLPSCHTGPPSWFPWSCLELVGRPRARACYRCESDILGGSELGAKCIFCVCSLPREGFARSADENFRSDAPLRAWLSDWTPGHLPTGGSVVALSYEKGLVCFPKSTPLSQKKSPATNLHACPRKKNLGAPGFLLLLLEEKLLQLLPLRGRRLGGKSRKTIPR